MSKYIKVINNGKLIEYRRNFIVIDNIEIIGIAYMTNDCYRLEINGKDIGFSSDRETIEEVISEIVVLIK